MNLIGKPLKFFNEVKTELSKVSWSTKEELIDSTMVVIVVTILAAVFIGLVDLSLSKILSIAFR